MDFRLYLSFLPASHRCWPDHYPWRQDLAYNLNEIYSRSIQVDRYAESSGNSLPSPDVDVFCGIISDADGYGIKNKFVIGTNTINILVTCSVVLDTKLKVFVGAGVDLLTDVLNSAGKHSFSTFLVTWLSGFLSWSEFVAKAFLGQVVQIRLADPIFVGMAHFVEMAQSILSWLKFRPVAPALRQLT